MRLPCLGGSCNLPKQKYPEKSVLEDYDGTLVKVDFYEFIGSDDLAMQMAPRSGSGFMRTSSSSLDIIYESVIGESMPLLTLISSSRNR